MTARETARKFTINDLVEAGIVPEGFEDDALARLAKHDTAHRAATLAEAADALEEQTAALMHQDQTDRRRNYTAPGMLRAIGVLRLMADGVADAGKVHLRGEAARTAPSWQPARPTVCPACLHAKDFHRANGCPAYDAVPCGCAAEVTS